MRVIRTPSVPLATAHRPENSINYLLFAAVLWLITSRVTDAWAFCLSFAAAFLATVKFVSVQRQQNRPSCRAVKRIRENGRAVSMGRGGGG